jgi:hypothetical protein
VHLRLPDASGEVQRPTARTELVLYHVTDFRAATTPLLTANVQPCSDLRGMIRPTVDGISVKVLAISFREA